ncbi:hypothetical protein BJD16_04825 [Aeromonas sobria]|uniref:Uncharacterized protein n=1 Tax=Aeromonas sobria TaxID=646 RepID=A0A1S2CU92_AERSO|nr:hypothetical protein BJD16_04825 [Aeromonas sobria]
MAFQFQPFTGHALERVGTGFLFGLGCGDLFFFVELGINALGQQGAGFSPPFSGCSKGYFWIGAKSHVGAFLIGWPLVFKNPSLPAVRFNPQL